VLRQLELSANGWIAPSTVPIAMAALREIARRPPPLKVGRLPPVPPQLPSQINGVSLTYPAMG
jgi:hypothetical protein